MSWHTALKESKLKIGKKKMITVARKMVLVGRTDDGYFATEALCRHMRWPLAYGGKVKDGCIRCPLHQTTHKLDDGELVEWSPFPLFPPYGKLLGKMSKKKDLKVYETRLKDGNIEIKIE
ncbi:MAG: Rieske (2Fe-2S) protein [Candidatus Poseidoniales archaeon]|jgi:nitrite reductase/ring-hydroxylating ferredoxin subunit|tara:strand:- start:836 stop:1195 length:360 start_codon:yes stop_codon:yes gene_type:complete